MLATNASTNPNTLVVVYLYLAMPTMISLAIAPFLQKPSTFIYCLVSSGATTTCFINIKM